MLGNFDLAIQTHADEAIIGLLEANVIGTPGKGMLYRHLKVREKIEDLSAPVFVSLKRNGRLLGVCCFSERKAFNQGAPVKSFYVRYFSFLEKFRRGKVVGGERKTTGLLKDEINKIFTAEGLLKYLQEKAIFYAYVDINNERSKALCEEFGFRTIRQFSPVLFSRFYPKKDFRVSKLDRRTNPKSLIGDFYSDYSLVSFDNIDAQNYYVIKNKDGDMVAASRFP